MFYTLIPQQRVYIEITNKIHGGPGWDLGSCLWSPSRSSDGKDTWSIMKSLNKGDLVFHSVKEVGGHKLIGASIVKSTNKIVTFEPPFPARWGGSESYYKVDLRDYYNLQKPISLKEFLDEYAEDIKDFTGSFYTKDLKVAQKYLSEIPISVYQKLNEFLKNNGEQFDITYNSTDAISDGRLDLGESLPDRYETVLTRIYRDTKIVRALKQEYKDVCQICGKTIFISENKNYSEGHHIKPLGGIHCGPDIKENIIVLCPNHHTEFDYGIIAISIDGKTILHKDSRNEFNRKVVAYVRDDIDEEYLEYHLKNIYKKTK